MAEWLEHQDNEDFSFPGAALARWRDGRGSPAFSAHRIAPLTGPMYQLFIMFMVTDPKTTASTVRERVIVAAAVALAEAAIRLAADYHVAALSALCPAPPILALAIVGEGARSLPSGAYFLAADELEH
jgi:hypothetical protein